MPGVAWDEEAVRRVAEVCDRVRGAYYNDAGPPPAPPVATSAWNLFVKVTSATQTHNQQPCTIQKYAQDTNTFSDEATPNTGWAAGSNAQLLPLGIYWGRFEGTLAADGLPVFVVSSAGEVVFLKTSGSFTGAVVAPSGSPAFYSGAKVEIFNLSGLTWSDGATVDLVVANGETQLWAGNRYLGIYQGLNPADGLPLYVVWDFALEFKDINRMTQLERVMSMELNSTLNDGSGHIGGTGTSWDGTSNDFVSRGVGARQLQLRTNGFSGNMILYRYCCGSAGMEEITLNVNFNNGLLQVPNNYFNPGNWAGFGVAAQTCTG